MASNRGVFYERHKRLAGKLRKYSALIQTYKLHFQGKFDDIGKATDLPILKIRISICFFLAKPHKNFWKDRAEVFYGAMSQKYTQKPTFTSLSQ